MEVTEQQMIAGILRQELRYRQMSNRKYSLRAFARDLKVSPSRLSEVINGRGIPSRPRTQALIEALGLSEKDISYYRRLHQQTVELSPKPTDEHWGALEEYEFIDDEIMQVTCEWHHFAILTVMRLDDFDGSSEWIGQRLGLPAEKVQNSLALLCQLGMVSHSSDSGYEVLKEHLETSQDIPSGALKISHRQSIQQAQEALDQISVDLRDITSITMAIDLDMIPRAKAVIRDFRRNLCALLESDKKNAVYNLNIQFYPLSKE